MAPNRGDARLGADNARSVGAASAASFWLPAKAGGEEAHLRATGSCADERTPAVLEGRTGWGGVPFGSARTVGTPSQPPPAFAGGGAKPPAEIASRYWWRSEERSVGKECVRTCIVRG